MQEGGGSKTACFAKSPHNSVSEQSEGKITWTQHIYGMMERLLPKCMFTHVQYGFEVPLTPLLHVLFCMCISLCICIIYFHLMSSYKLSPNLQEKSDLCQF